ncbi:ribonuclease P protein component [Thermoproteota archaeon]
MLNLRFTFPLTRRIRKKVHFKYVYAHAKRMDNALVRIYVSQSFKERGGVAFIASKRVGNAVQRNKCRRRLSEIYRLNQHKIMNNIDIIFVAKNRLLDISFDQALNQIQKLLREKSFLKD